MFATVINKKIISYIIISIVSSLKTLSNNMRWQNKIRELFKIIFCILISSMALFLSSHFINHSIVNQVQKYRIKLIDIKKNTGQYPPDTTHTYLGYLILYSALSDSIRFDKFNHKRQFIEIDSGNISSETDI